VKERPHVDGGAGRLDPSRLELRQIQQVAHQPLHSRGVLSRRVQEARHPGIEGSPDPLLEEGEAHPDRRDRRPQLVGRGRDELTLEAVELRISVTSRRMASTPTALWSRRHPAQRYW
jgi:hypothetical protein